MEPDTLIWQTKLAARIHDPAEKALVLLRDPAGHEGGTSRALTRLLGVGRLDTAHIDPDNDEVLSHIMFKKGIPASIYRHIQRADWWASAADRPQFPMQEITIQTRSGDIKTLKVADWAQVRWTKSPMLIHPLTGKEFDLGSLQDVSIESIKDRSFKHFSQMFLDLKEAGDQDDFKKLLLAYWRFGPELEDEQDHDRMGLLWSILPADTRIPDHTIWDHLDLTSAFAGAFAADQQGEVALLSLSLGPVQSFIAAARTTSDLWAGSHLLSRLAWEAMKPVCEQLGPDAILFPRLRGVPQVDVWLRDECHLPKQWFSSCDWQKSATDSNPLFTAALPNRFVAIVPKDRARDLVNTIEKGLRSWMQKLGERVVYRLLTEASYSDTEGSHCYQQIHKQLDGFPELHWAIVPFSLIRIGNQEKQTDLDTSLLSKAVADLMGKDASGTHGFLNSPAWKLLSKNITHTDGSVFYTPKPGVLYPAVFDLAERVLAAAKMSRTFEPLSQKGWRCSLSGETEWLATTPEQLLIPAGQRLSRNDPEFVEDRHTETLWTRIADVMPSWARKGEHLGGLSAIKRLWPMLFAEEIEDILGREVGRFVVSTHTMSLAHQLDTWLSKTDVIAQEQIDKVRQFGSESVVLPKKLMKYRNPERYQIARSLPALLEMDDDDSLNERQSLVRSLLSPKNGQLESYYAVIQMDGDRMGAWLAGGEDFAISYEASFHHDVKHGFKKFSEHNAAIAAYAQQKRALSPNRHLAISGALNDFSQTLVPYVVEQEFLGRLIYSGGDDVLAMFPVKDVLPAMDRLRCAYSGYAEQNQIDRSRWDYSGHAEQNQNGLFLENGFALLKLNGKMRLMRMMGDRATASCGCVIAHHQAPLSAVLRELRISEARAKHDGGRNAFSITIIKRSGGALYLTAKWGKPLDTLNRLIAFLAHEEVSRRAAYHCLEWMTDLPEPDEQNASMLVALLGYQFRRQSSTNAVEQHEVSDLVNDMVQLVLSQPEKRLQWLGNFLSVAEFLSRELRYGDAQ